MKEKNQKSFEQPSIILDELEPLNEFDDNHMSTILALATNEDSEIRSRVAEILIFAEPEKAEKILLLLSDDRDKLVRTNACDSLGICNSEQVLFALFKKAKKDSYFLVRGYAVLSIADVAKNGDFDSSIIYKNLKNIFDKEKKSWVKICYFRSFYILGYHEYFNSLTAAINNSSYQDRCSVLNSLRDIIDKNNVEGIKHALQERLKVEEAYAVSSNIEKLLTDIENMNF